MSATQHGTEIAEDRALSDSESALVQWLLSQGGKKATCYLSQASRIRVVSRCACGCASLNFDIDGGGWRSPGGMDILIERRWHDQAGHLFEVFIFSKANTLAGIEVYSVDGLATPRTLPTPQELATVD
jgi:hypothetical protein